MYTAYINVWGPLFFKILNPEGTITSAEINDI
jgi:hypothetical protein